MTHTVSLEQIDLVLRGLPASHVVGSAGASRLVLGPTGAFVVFPDDHDGLTRDAAANHLAIATRETLADHLRWVPFVDALLITATDSEPRAHATVVTLDLLSSVLLDGPIVIDTDSCRTVGSLLHAGTLAGWRPGLPTGDGSIDLCDQPARLHH